MAKEELDLNVPQTVDSDVDHSDESLISLMYSVILIESTSRKSV